MGSGITHKDVGAAIAPDNLAAFPPSLEVNADISEENIYPCRNDGVSQILVYNGERNAWEREKVNQKSGVLRNGGQ